MFMNNYFYLHFDGNYYAGDHIDIHDNQSVNIFQGDVSQPATKEVQHDVENISPVATIVEDIPLFRFIHPSVTSDAAKRQVHDEIRNLVRQFPMQEICRYLRNMCKENRIYINVKPEAMFSELHRMGMPDESHPGYSYKNFMNYFNINTPRE